MTYLPSAVDRAVAVARPLPAAIIEARAAVFNPLLCQDLNSTARRVLYGILTFLSLRDVAKAVFPRRDLLRAESLLNSEATLYRGLKLLVDQGYITRSQARRTFGEFHLSPIRLTAKALSMLGLDQLIHRQRPLKMRDGYIKKEHTKREQSFQNTTQPAKVTQSTDTGETGDSADIDRQTGLPSELLRLLTLDVGKGTVCWLMLQARLKGKRLGNVVATVWHRIRSLRGRAVVAYLLAMLAKPLDFAWIAQQRSQASSEDQELAHAKAVLLRIGSLKHGIEVRKRNGEFCGMLEACESGTPAVVGSHGSFPVNLSFAKALMKGDLVMFGEDGRNNALISTLGLLRESEAGMRAEF